MALGLHHRSVTLGAAIIVNPSLGEGLRRRKRRRRGGKHLTVLLGMASPIRRGRLFGGDVGGLVVLIRRFYRRQPSAFRGRGESR